MRKVISKGIIFLMLPICLMYMTGCTSEIMFDDQSVNVSERSQKKCDIELYINQEIKLGKYEPYEGIYLGAYVEKNKSINGDLAVFEDLVSQTQTFKIFQYTVGEGFPSQEILKCIAQNKVPYIKLILGKDFDLTPLYHMIADINAGYSVPIFIELFPLTSQLAHPETYKETYERAYEIIHKYLDNAVVVWSIDDSRLYDMPLYYPGDKFVDWVGINLYVPKYKQNIPYEFNYLEEIDFWYKSFQKSKPMLISALAVSHYSRVDHTYTLSDAHNKLNLFYTKLLSAYPRIKGVIYIDIDMGEVTKNGNDDYRITSQKQLTHTMAKIFKNKYFLDELEEVSYNKPAYLYMKYRIIAAQFDEEVYLPKSYINIFSKKLPLSKISMIEDLNGEKFYRLEDIKQYADIHYETRKQ